MSFWEARFLWQEPMLAAVIGSALLGYLGFFVVLRRIAFMSAALSQVSGLGVATSFLVGAMFGIEPHSSAAVWCSPTAYALIFASVGAASMALPARSRRVTPESVVALGYLAASALVIVVLSSPSIAQEAHEIGDLLFGNAVVVQHEHLIALGAAALIVAVVHLFYFKDFLFCSFDAETARSIRYPVQRLDLALHLTLAISIALATRALGALPVFAFLVLPAGAALLITERLRVVVILAVLIAVLSACGGYYLSWVGSLPTGPIMVALCASSWAFAGAIKLARARS